MSLLLLIFSREKKKKSGGEREEREAHSTFLLKLSCGPYWGIKASRREKKGGRSLKLRGGGEGKKGPAFLHILPPQRRRERKGGPLLLSRIGREGGKRAQNHPLSAANSLG